MKTNLPSYRTASETSKILSTRVIDGNGDPISNDSSIWLKSPEKVIKIWELSIVLTSSQEAGSYASVHASKKFLVSLFVLQQSSNRMLLNSTFILS